MFEGREIKKVEGGGQEGQDYAVNNWIPQNRPKALDGVGGLKKGCSFRWVDYQGRKQLLILFPITMPIFGRRPEKQTFTEHFYWRYLITTPFGVDAKRNLFVAKMNCL